jgi:predicted amidohydrolase
MREITIAAVQMKPDLGEMEDNLVKMSDFVARIVGRQKVDLILFPELITSGYELGVRFTNAAQLIPGPTVNLMSQRAQEFGVYIAFGMVAKERVESILYDAAVLIGPDGDLMGRYHKVHLRGEERMSFREGYRLPVFETEMGTIGLLLGWDLAFPEVARSMVLDGAELLCVLASWYTDEIDEWCTYLKARAYENACFVAGSNRIGEDVTLAFGGASMIVGPRGKMLASLDGKPSSSKKSEEKTDENEKKDEKAGAEKKEEKSDTPEGYCVATIDLDDVRKARERHQTIQARHPTIYRAVVRRY